MCFPCEIGGEFFGSGFPLRGVSSAARVWEVNVFLGADFHILFIFLRVLMRVFVLYICVGFMYFSRASCCSVSLLLMFFCIDVYLIVFLCIICCYILLMRIEFANIGSPIVASSCLVFVLLISVQVTSNGFFSPLFNLVGLDSHTHTLSSLT